VSASLRKKSTREGRSTETVAGPRHFLDLKDFDAATLRQMLDVAANYKRGGVSSRPLAGKTLALIFEKPARAPASRSRSACASLAATSST